MCRTKNPSWCHYIRYHFKTNHQKRGLTVLHILAYCVILCRCSFLHHLDVPGFFLGACSPLGTSASAASVGSHTAKESAKRGTGAGARANTLSSWSQSWRWLRSSSERHVEPPRTPVVPGMDKWPSHFEGVARAPTHRELWIILHFKFGQCCAPQCCTVSCLVSCLSWSYYANLCQLDPPIESWSVLPGRDPVKHRPRHAHLRFISGSPPESLLAILHVTNAVSLTCVGINEASERLEPQSGESMEPQNPTDQQLAFLKNDALRRAMD